MAVYVTAKIVGYSLPVTLKRAGELIQRARDATGMDIAALATRVGQSPSTIRRLESGDTEHRRARHGRRHARGRCSHVHL